MTPAEAKNEQTIRQAYQIAEAKNLRGWIVELALQGTHLGPVPADEWR